MAESKKQEVERAKKALSKMDPELVMMAIRQADVDFKEVDRIKDFLSKCNTGAVQYAIAELQQDVTTKEIKSIKSQLKSFAKEAVYEAAVESGFATEPGKCLEPINCNFNCIQVMAVLCKQDVYVKFPGYREVINPEILEGIVNRAVIRALKAK